MSSAETRFPAMRLPSGHLPSRKRNAPERSARRTAGALGLAAVLAGTALAAQDRARRAERRYPPIGRFIEVDGVRTHYVEQGFGRPIVLFHGNGATLEDFTASRLLPILAQRYRVVAFDRPGYGYTERPRDRIWTPWAQAEFFRQAFEALGLERPIVLGHSWGSLVAVALALHSPADVRALALLSGYYFPTVRLDVPLMSPPAIPILGDAMRYTVSPLLARIIAKGMIPMMFWPRRVHPNFRKDFPLELTFRPWQLRASSEETALMIPAAASLQGEYKHVSVPTLIMAGDDDQVADVDRQSKRLGEEIPDSEVRLFPRLGHMMHYFAPEKIADQIDRLSERAGAARDDAPPLGAALPA